LAAQASVLEGLSDPQKTWESNVFGTLNLLQALRVVEHDCVCVIVTSDKVYLNNETGTAFTEDSPLGGNDPYSSSKAATEILIHSYRKSFEILSDRILLATARAGNVIGGGDWLENRLIPDLVRSFQARETLVVRNSNSVRPWQFVLDAVTGYLILAEKLFSTRAANLQSAFNFGPSTENQYSVDTVVNKFSALLPVNTTNLGLNRSSKESVVLALDSSKARVLLNWVPRLDFDDSLTWTTEWYKLFCEGNNPYQITRNQIVKWLERET
jgi:CDP-glucose 4,6-dehydratase